MSQRLLSLPRQPASAIFHRAAPVLWLVLALGCEATPDDSPEVIGSTAPSLDGLDEAEIARFQAGAREFSEVDNVSQGLGPLFNASSCVQCHNTPFPGGSSLMRVMRAECPNDTDAQNTMVHLFSTRPELGASNLAARHCDAVVAQRRSSTLLGAGLIEAIPDSQIETRSATQPTAIAGRPAYVTDLVTGKQRVGHFGWKAQHATLHSFAGDAYRNEMGITNELFPTEVAPNGDISLLKRMDPTPDPEAQVGSLEKLADFMRMLAPPPRRNSADDSTVGAALFERVGCDGCHYAGYQTVSSEPALNQRPVLVYSDLLLHDIGTGDGIAQGDAGPNELRTAPLWGTRFSELWLHDGRATTIDQAIRMHGAEALESRRAYEQLQDDERVQLLAFLNEL